MLQKNDPTTRYLRSPDIVSRAIGDEIILVPVRRSLVAIRSLFTLNQTGGFVWEQLAVPRTVEEIATALTGDFDVTFSRANEDVRGLLKQLLEEGCVSEVSEQVSNDICT
jgi:hypothetical protein